jgi:isopentenyl-diphosphate Delta-isomerase
MEERKKDHILLAFESQTEKPNPRFLYEPLFGVHPTGKGLPPLPFLGKEMKAPIWISSMTGGTAMARTINENLARACAEFGLGMGLGSCRPLLESNERFEDFNLRPILGKDRPFFANLGVAQVAELARKGQLQKITDMVGKLEADGLIFHINPLQEWLQPEGDVFTEPAADTLDKLLAHAQFPVIVKEVGQGMGPKSLAHLLQLPLAAIDFGAFGGTNFSKLEWLRAQDHEKYHQSPFVHVGHTAPDMLGFVKDCLEQTGGKTKVPHLIISGGVKDFLEGWALIQQAPLPAVYGQASAFLEYARGEYLHLSRFVKSQVDGLEMAYRFMRLKE